jgi:hypothetical protein
MLPYKPEYIRTHEQLLPLLNRLELKGGRMRPGQQLLM